MSKEPIPFLSLEPQHTMIKTAVQQAVQQVYDRSAFVLGEEVNAFEKEYAAWHEIPFCIGVGNGLDALTMSLLACDVKPGDEVIVPAHTYLATWLAVSRTGATVVPVEPDESTFNIDTSRIEEVITPRTKAILPVHLYGQACNMTSVLELAERHKLFIVEDNAQAQGSRWLKTLTGSWGTINATSFYPTKNLGALGDGGAVTTSHAQLATFVKQYRNYGLKEKNIALYLGVNSRLDEIQAAILRVKLKHVEAWNEQRRELAALYLEQLKDVGDIALPLSDKEAHHVYHLFVIRTKLRDKLSACLTERGIGTMIHYPVPPHLQKPYESLNFRKGDFPITEKIAETCLSLPLWPGMTEQHVERVCEGVRAFFR